MCKAKHTPNLEHGHEENSCLSLQSGKIKREGMGGGVLDKNAD